MNGRRFALLLLLTLLARSASAAGVAIAWNPTTEPEVAGYLVRYGSQPHDYQTQVDVGLATTLTVDGLVSGQTYYFTVQAYTRGGAASTPATELATVIVGAAGARLIAPLDGQRDVTSAQVFTWTAVADAQAYQFQLGTTPGAADLGTSGETRRTTWTTPTLPAGQRLYAQLRTKVANRWSTHAVAFVSAPTAKLVAPIATATDVSHSETFVWSGITGAEAYRLVVGTTPDGHDVMDSGETQAVSVPVTGLAPDQTLYARVATRLAGVWTVDAVTLTTAHAARLLGDATALGKDLRWTTILGADAYTLHLGTAPGLSDLLDSGAVLGTTVAAPVLPAGQPIFATLATHLAGVWTARATTLTLAGATLDAPTGAVTRGDRLTWTPIRNADAYALTIGTTEGAKDVVDTGALQATSLLVPALPAHRTLYVTLWTQADGVWNGTASSVTTR